MSFFKSLFGKKPAIDTPKEFEFSIAEIICSGDYYRYNVTAENREEALKKLVIYFFGNSTHEINESIRSETGIVSRPQHDSFICNGLPRWFGKRISGHVRDDNYDYQKSLEEYGKKNNIILKGH